MTLRPGDRVRLHPRSGRDVLDLVLDGRTAVVEALEEDMEGAMHVAVVVEDDPGRDLGAARRPGHRFFFSPEEVEPLPEEAPAAPGARILVAGVGNVFLGDDGFGVALAARLAERRLPAGVEVVDFGIRGMDLAFALRDGYDAVVLLDATPRGERPGTLYVIEVNPGEEPAGVPDAHGMDPARVFALARSMGGELPPAVVVGCEPRTRMSAEDADVVFELSPPVQAALDEAVPLVESVLGDLIHERTTKGELR